MVMVSIEAHSEFPNAPYLLQSPTRYTMAFIIETPRPDEPFPCLHILAEHKKLCLDAGD